MKFKTIKEATEYYFSKIDQTNYSYNAKTNNSHDEEEARLDSWLEEQEIEE